MGPLFSRWDYHTVSFVESQPILQCLYTGLSWDQRHRFWWFLSTTHQFRPPTPSVFRATDSQNQETRLEISTLGIGFTGLHCILQCICDAYRKVIMLWVVSNRFRVCKPTCNWKIWPLLIRKSHPSCFRSHLPKSENTFAQSDLAFIMENEFRLYDGFDKNRKSSRSSIFLNTGPISIIFGSFESKKFKLSCFLGVAMLPLNWFFRVSVAMLRFLSLELDKICASAPLGYSLTGFYQRAARNKICIKSSSPMSIRICFQKYMLPGDTHLNQSSKGQ